MGTSFEISPLVELITELRWDVPSLETPTQPNPSITFQISTIPSTTHEEFFMRFSSAIAAKGFVRLERLVSQGFPSLPFQPVCRFRKTSDQPSATLYQIGANVFTANATPPYQSWDEFEPVIRDGVETLLLSREAKHKGMPFNIASVRYINAFFGELTQGATSTDFLSDVLEFKIGLPTCLDQIRVPKADLHPNLQVSFPTISGYNVSFRIAHGLINNQPAVIMDNTASASTSIPPETVSVMEAFSNAHRLLHDSFMDMTKKIHYLMKPRGN